MVFSQIPFRKLDSIMIQPRTAPGQPDIVLNAPSVETRDIVRKRFPDGRVLTFTYMKLTFASMLQRYVVWELVDIDPPLTCSCTPQGAADVVMCDPCRALVCSRHAGCCGRCGRIGCSRCMQGVIVYDTRAVVCNSCADILNSSGLKKTWRSINGLIWG